MLRLTTFGGLALTRDGVTLTGAAAQRSRLSLLALLATAGPTGFSRDKLLLYLWPESDEERARHALKQAVYSLRRELGSEEVIVGTASLSLNPTIITSDAREFEMAVAAGDLATAVSLYTGPFLDGFHLKDSTEYERWSAEQRSRFAHMWVSSVEKLAAECEAKGAWREAAGYWRTLAAAEPLSGPLALSLMKALAESGDLGAALQQFKIHEALLREEIGSAPEPAVSAFAESLRNGTWTRSPEPIKRPSPAAVTTAVATAPTEAGEAPPAIRTGSGPVQIGAARRRRRRTKAALAFVLGMLLVVSAAIAIGYASLSDEELAALKLIRNRPEPKLRPRQIVVAPLRNMTNDKTVDHIGPLFAEWFADNLREADFTVVTARDARIGDEVVQNIPRALRSSNDAQDLGKETQSQYVVGGSYYYVNGVRDSLMMNISVIDVASGRNVRTLGPFRGHRDQQEPLIRRMLDTTVAYLHAEVDTTAAGQMTKYGSLTALDVYGRVNSAWEHFFSDPRDTTSVFAELDSAALLDQSYVMPGLMKAYMLDVKSQWAGVREIVDRLKPIQPRMARLERAAMELFEADLRGDALRRPSIARRIAAMAPSSTEMPLLRAVSALYIGYVDEAIDALKDVDDTRGMNIQAPTYHEWASATYHYAGNSSAEERSTDKLTERFPRHPATRYALARLQAAEDDSDLRKTLSKGIPSPKDDRDPVLDRIDLTMFAAREARSHGHAATAKRLIEDLLKSPEFSALKDARRRARVFYDAGDYASARREYEAIRAADSTDAEALGRIGASAHRLGDSAAVREADERLAGLQRSYLMGAHHRWRASIAAVQGRTDEAIALLDRAVRGGHRLMDNPPNLTVHLDVDFLGIENTEAYKAMLQDLRESAIK